MPILILIGTQRSLARSRCCDEFRDYVSAVGEESGCGEALREPERLLLAGVGAAASSFPPSVDFTAERDLRPRAGVASEPRSTSTGVGAAGGDTSSDACAVDLRPSPRAFANVERRSE